LLRQEGVGFLEFLQHFIKVILHQVLLGDLSSILESVIAH
jgi:hypothetical protein